MIARAVKSIYYDRALLPDQRSITIRVDESRYDSRRAFFSHVCRTARVCASVQFRSGLFNFLQREHVQLSTSSPFLPPPPPPSLSLVRSAGNHPSMPRCCAGRLHADFGRARSERYLDLMIHSKLTVHPACFLILSSPFYLSYLL
jgi:hypothetical protein